MSDEIKPGFYKDGNPKTQYGQKKPPMWYAPFPALYKAALVHLQGALKYGHFNWRIEPVSVSTYMDAAMRHMEAWVNGEENAPDTGLHHLAHAVANLNIIMDAQEYDTMIDDRSDATFDMDAFYKRLEPQVAKVYEDWGDFMAKKGVKAPTVNRGRIEFETEEPR